MKRSYRLVATDLDGTLFDHTLVIPPRTRQAFELAKSRGAKIVLATGRMLPATLPFATSLGIDTPLITYQGAVIHDPKSGRDIWHHRMPLAETLEAINALRTSGMHLNLYVDHHLIIEEMTPAAAAYLELTGVTPLIVPRFENFLFSSTAPTKLLAIGTVEEADRWHKILFERFEEALYVTKSQAQFLELAPFGVTKGTALAHVAAKLNIQPAEIIAFGDGMNDAEMLAFAGLGVAMGNAPEELKKIADKVAPSIEEQGIAQVLEEIFG